MDKDGFLFITGRKKDMIVLKNGKKVFPDELEMLINRLDEVEECIVFGMPDKKDKNDIKLSVKVVYNKEYVKEKYGNISKEKLEKIDPLRMTPIEALNVLYELKSEVEHK